MRCVVTALTVCICTYPTEQKCLHTCYHCYYLLLLPNEPYRCGSPPSSHPFTAIFLRRYDPRIGWLHPDYGSGPNADKVSQVREQRGLTRFMILPDVFLCRFPGWDRSRLKEFQEKWKKHHTPTPFNQRRFATFRDQEQACASRLWLGQKGGGVPRDAMRLFEGKRSTTDSDVVGLFA